MVELLNTIARLWWDWTASMLWQVGLLILLIGCVDLLIRKWAWPQLRYALWSLILVKLLLPPTLSLPSGVVPELRPRVAQALRWLNSEKPAADENPGSIADSTLSVDPQSTEFAMSTGGIVKAEGLVCSVPVRAYEEVSSWKLEVSSDASALQTSNFALPTSKEPPYGVTTNALEAATRPALAANPHSAIGNHVTPDPDPGPQLTRQFYAMAIWLLGTVILGIWLFLRLYSVAGRHAYRAAATSLPQSFYNHLAGCAARLGLRRIPRVVVTKRLTSPAVFGVFSPVLLMPKGYLSKLSRRDTEHMLLHELAHIKRGDLVMHGLYLLLQIVYWYNPLLWLVRQQVHHLRELSCDGTVAELLRERTPAYRQTLLETARRLLATSAEPGLGLLGLFEDSNRLLVRLNWLTKPTWRYKTMKRVTVATIAVLMFACVLPMAQARESASSERRSPVVREEDQPSQDQLSRDIAALQARLDELMAQQRQLQEQLRALSERRDPVRPSREAPRESRARTAVQPRGERVPEHMEVAPPEPRSGPGGGRPTRESIPHGSQVTPPAPPAPPHAPERVPPEAREQVGRAQEQIKRAQEEAAQAMKEAARAQQNAKARAEVGHAKAQEQQYWVKQMQAWAQQLERWEHSEEMQQWQRDMDTWGEQMGRWGQNLTRRQTETADGSEAPEAAPMPVMPPMPPMPAVPAMPPTPAAENLDVNVQADVNPVPVPHVRGGGPVHMPRPEIHTRVTVPRIDPPLPPGIPEKRENQQEAVSRTEHDIDLAPGQLLDAKNEMGSIAVRGGDGPGCRLVVTVKGRADTMEEAQAIVDQVKPVIKPSQDGVSVTMTKPEQEDREHPNRVVTMELVVPREAQIRLSQAFGDIRLTSLDGTVRAVSNMGSIRATDVRGQVTLESNFGAIDFVAPRDFSAKVQAKSQMGSILSDLPLEVAKSDAFSMGSKASGTLGGGEGNVSLTTNMGSIRIRSQSSAPVRTERSRREARPEPRSEPREVF